MSVRPVDWRDLFILHRYRDRCIYLDSVRLLTQGPNFVPLGAIFSNYAPSTGVFTYQSKVNGGSPQVLFAQATYLAGAPAAHLSFLAPETAVESEGLFPLLEQLTTEVGERGAYHLLADVNEGEAVFEVMRRAGFAIYARQRIWRLSGDPQRMGDIAGWRQGSSQDIIGVRSLYCNLVPGLVQQVEPPPQTRLTGMVLREGSELLAYVELKHGPKGIRVQPFFHPEMEKVPEHLIALLRHLVHHQSRPVYVCVRSYQSWLEPIIQELGAEVGILQAVMVKRLAILQKARAYAKQTVERGQPEISAPVTHSKTN